MHKNSLLLIFMLSAISTSAQMASWKIEPKYDNIVPSQVQNVLLSDSAGVTTVWSTDGRRLYSTPEQINPFVEGKAVITKKGTNKILGFIDTKGRFTELPESEVAYDFPFFSDGYICIKAGRGYGYYSNEGDNSQFLFFDTAYPFSKGYSVYKSYNKPEEKKDAYFNFYTTDDKTVVYALDNKQFDFRNISFLSSVAEDDRAIAIIKNKVYWFNAADGTFSPMYGGGIEDKKNHVQVDGKIVETLANPGDKLHFNGKYGKNNIVEFSFDRFLKPDTIIMDDRAITFPKASVQAPEYKTQLGTVDANDKKGITIDGITVLPPQFESIGLMYDENAVVKLNGKYGILSVIKDAPYNFVMNDGKDIGFRHSTFETQLRLDLPKELLSNSIDFDVPEESGCKLDKRFSEAKDTRAGNYLVYKCILTIPTDLPDRLTDITYPVTVSYNGLVFPEHPLTVKAWHLKSYTADVDESDITIIDDGAIFNVDITALRKVSDNDYPFTVEAKSDSLLIKSEKISETRFKYSVEGLQGGKNHIDIVVTEKGCPSIVFPFEIDYVKPTKRTKAQLTVSKKDALTEQEPESEIQEETPEVPATEVTETETENETVIAVPAAEAPNLPAAPEAAPAAPVNTPAPTTPTVNFMPNQKMDTPTLTNENDSIKNANLMRFLQ